MAASGIDYIDPSNVIEMDCVRAHVCVFVCAGSGGKGWGTWLAQSIEHVTLDLGVVSSSPTLGIEIT